MKLTYIELKYLISLVEKQKDYVLNLGNQDHSKMPMDCFHKDDSMAALYKLSDKLKYGEQ